MKKICTKCGGDDFAQPMLVNEIIYRDGIKVEVVKLVWVCKRCSFPGHQVSTSRVVERKEADGTGKL